MLGATHATSPSTFAGGPIGAAADSSTFSVHKLVVVRGMGGGPRPPKKYKYKGKNPKKNKNQMNQKQKTKLPPRPKAKSEETQKAPPAYLYPTASPYAYIAGCAAEEVGIDPRTLFVDAREGRVPPSFMASQFEYVSPKNLGHELPDFPIPEVCFLGKSNVGKSSLINALTKKKELAKISKTPGRTQQVNYFALVKKDKCKLQGKGVYAFRPSDSTGFLIDLPGYGYAVAPDDKVSDWQAKTQQFLLERRDSTYLRRTFLLIDARHGVANFDRAVMGWFDEASIPYSIVLTKADRVGRPQLVRIVNDVCMRYHSQLYGTAGGGSEGIYQSPVVHVTSSRDGEGIETLMWAIDGDFIADDTRGEVVDIECNEWGRADGKEGDELSALDYKELEYEYEDGEDEIERTGSNSGK